MQFVDVSQYFGSANRMRGGWMGMPPWARTVVGIFAIPGIVLVALSIAAFLVSILALLLLTVPVYTLLRRLTEWGRNGSNAGGFPTGAVSQPHFGQTGRGVKHVDATIIE